MIIDTHLHERTFSGDSKMNLLEMVAEAKRKGLDGICITDHDKIGLTQYAAKVALPHLCGGGISGLRGGYRSFRHR